LTDDYSNVSPGLNSQSIITVVRDPDRTLGKQFTLNSDGSINKQSVVNLAFGMARMHVVETPQELADLIRDTSEDTHAAIINASFSDIGIGEDFAILSEAQLQSQCNISKTDRDSLKGVHRITYQGSEYKAVGRFKENVRPSAWQFFDRDIDEHTPQEFAHLTTDKWLLKLNQLLGGFDISYCHVGSTSSRVYSADKTCSTGNGHVWFKLANPDDLERFRIASQVTAAEKKMTWLKPRYSRTEPSKVVGHSLTTIFDPSVFTPGRLVFIGKPVVNNGLIVKPLSVTVHGGANEVFDSTAVLLPDSLRVREITRKAGVELQINTSSNGLRIANHDLSLSTEIETQHHGVLTVRQIVEKGLSEKIRCQTPFRASSSWAGFININDEGAPFVYDVGTNTTHWLNETDAEAVKIIPAVAVVAELLPKTVTDSAAVLEPNAINALAAIKQINPAEYQRKRNELKRANILVSLADMDRAVKARMAEVVSAQTHHGYAKSLITCLTEMDFKPVGHQGSLFTLNPTINLWHSNAIDSLVRIVAEMHDGKDHCSRSTDYKAIAEHAISLASDDTFFSDAPNGLACPGGFYQIVDNEITKTELLPEHRQRVMLDFNPAKMATPIFDAFLSDTFKSDYDGEELQQKELIQEIFGGIMLGIFHKFQTAVLFYEPFGRAGKGTIEKLLRQLVPAEYISAISPFKWNQDYHLASLAEKRLNVVGELPETEPIPSAAFKTVIGGDLVTGRHPTHRPITFSNEAAHLFMSNHLITTKDQSEAFFARWKIVEFPNSRLRLRLPVDPGLAQRMIDNELPGIAYWALEGAARLLSNGKLPQSSAHDRLLAKWRRSTSTLEEFIHDECDLCQDGTFRRSEFYVAYTQWCSDNGRKPLSKGRIKEQLEHNIGMGIRLVEINGHETFRGVMSKPSIKRPHFFL
jgi:P4 family phage/plasmid primase-like protien